MSGAVAFVMLVSSTAAYGIHAVLAYFDALYLQLIAYIAVIASTVQLVEMFIKKFSPRLFRALGIFLPLITTNCSILGVALFQTLRQYNFVQSLVFSLGAGVGFGLALVIMAGLREELDLADVPGIVRGAALTLMIAGVLSLSFMGFGGMGG
jgi:electron transport complex protein RnfA